MNRIYRTFFSGVLLLTATVATGQQINRVKIIRKATPVKTVPATTVDTTRRKSYHIVRATPATKTAVKDSRKQWAVDTKLKASGMFILPYKPLKPQSGATAPTNTEVQGPNLTLGKDVSILLGGNGFEYFLDKLNIFREVYEDKNPNAGYFYYLPKSYNMKWDRGTGQYSFYVYYLSADAEGRGEVIVTAELTPGVSQDDIALAETLLSKKMKREIRLRPLPLRDTPKVSFGSALTNFDVKPESVSTNVPTDFLEPIIVSWKMERRVDDLVGAMMNNIGLSGNVDFLPHAEGDQAISVPVRLKVNDDKTFGKMEYTQADGLLNGFLNPIDYPVVLRDLVVMRTKASKELTIERIALASYEVAPQETFSSFTPEEKDRVLSGNNITKLWAEYSIKPCSPCNEQVTQKILGGTSTSRVKGLEVQVLTPLGYSGANSLKLMIRSKQGDPKGTSEVMLPILTVTKDNQTLAGGELFVAEGEDLQYQYQLALIQPDGETLMSEWVDASDPFIIVGEDMIRKHFDVETSADEPVQPVVTDGQ
ncbi:hypothetical protein KK062_15395 [Fulvivirgaceae bacterium PWU5]|uniref:Uncharacterized protein n=1 Tax=Dawidia cretensis TaxID=2782350 RepID=A0AAP2E101_9BACT|nr:hypothetical protein [Dawidia cretensis]MBT1709627.1 hypothetical protein [Dawidia cretensis]